MTRLTKYLCLIATFLAVIACAGSATVTDTAVPPTSAAGQPTAASAPPTATGEAAPPPVTPPIGAPGPGFSVLGKINRDPSQSAQNPWLAIGSTTPGSQPNLWVAWSENSSGNARQIFVSELADGTFQPRGASLNLHVNAVGDNPSITFAGEGNAVPWVTWVEPSPGFKNVAQVFASRFSAATGLWQQAGQDRGGGEASLNLKTDQAGGHPVIFAGSTEPGKPPSPWVAWEENVFGSKFIQIFVSRGIKDDSDTTLIGGFRWETVGQVKQDGLQTLNVDRFRNSLHATAVFAETGNSVPWVTWHEEGHDRPSRIFTARGVADAKAPGGFKWINVPTCDPNDETTCSLNINPLRDAKNASMAAGSVVPGEAAFPWIAWPEIGPNGKWQIFVSRLDPNTRNGFLQVGGSLNIDPNHDARDVYIAFVNNTPYVGWLEDDGTGNFHIHIRHLGSDPQTGTWVQDSPAQGFNQNPGFQVNGTFNAVSFGDTLFLTWVETDPATNISQVIVSALRTK